MTKIPFHLKLIRGAIGRRFVIKHYGKKIVMTRFPDMTHMVPSNQQRARRQLFAHAVAYAKVINNDPQLKIAYQLRLPKGKSVYRAAIQQYLRLHKACNRPKTPLKETFVRIKVEHKAAVVLIRHTDFLCPAIFISQRKYRDTG